MFLFYYVNCVLSISAGKSISLIFTKSIKETFKLFSPRRKRKQGYFVFSPSYLHSTDRHFASFFPRFSLEMKRRAKVFSFSDFWKNNFPKSTIILLPFSFPSPPFTPLIKAPEFYIAQSWPFLIFSPLLRRGPAKNAPIFDFYITDAGSGNFGFGLFIVKSET